VRRNDIYRFLNSSPFRFPKRKATICTRCPCAAWKCEQKFLGLLSILGTRDPCRSYATASRAYPLRSLVNNPPPSPPPPGLCFGNRDVHSGPFFSCQRKTCHRRRDATAAATAAAATQGWKRAAACGERRRARAERARRGMMAGRGRPHLAAM